MKKSKIAFGMLVSAALVFAGSNGQAASKTKTTTGQSGKTATQLRQECFEEMAKRFPVSSQTASDVNARTTAYMNCARSKGVAP